jgi:hypothetical protein
MLRLESAFQSQIDHQPGAVLLSSSQDGDEGSDYPLTDTRAAVSNAKN